MYMTIVKQNTLPQKNIFFIFLLINRVDNMGAKTNQNSTVSSVAFGRSPEKRFTTAAL